MKYITYIVVIMSILLSGCTSKPSSQTQENELHDALGSLTPQQKMTLLAMIDAYDENRQALDSWTSSQPSVARLVEIEGDLKLLIRQLASISQNQGMSESQNVPPEPNTQPPESAATVGADQLTVEQSESMEEATSPIAPQEYAANDNAPMLTNFNGFSIQLSALNSLQGVKAYWLETKRKFPELFAEQTPFYQSFINDNNNEMFRLKVGQFSSKEDAVMFCRRFATEGGKCFATANTNGYKLLL